MHQDGATGPPKLLALDPGRISSRAPAVFAAMAASWFAVESSMDARLLGTVRRRVESLLESEGGLDLDGTHSPEESSILKLVDQFVDCVAEVTEDHLAGPRKILGGDGLRDLLETLYVLDQLSRLYLSHSRLFGRPAPVEVTPSTGSHDSLIALALTWHHRVLELKHLDLLTTEAARLRGAWYHTCRLCASLRIVDEGRVVIDEELAQRIRTDHPDTLPSRLSSAVKFADAHVIDPRTLLTRELCEELTSVFREDELLELTLDMTAWNHQKVTVSLRIEPPVRPDALSELMIRDDGTVKIGRAIG